MSLTGSGGKLASELIGGHYVNEIIAQSTSVSKLYPKVKTIIEMGGEDSKLIFMDPPENNSSKLSDFLLNNLCAADTGSFLDQQAKRIGVAIENEIGELSLKSENPPRIAGRCSVFAKSDMIHLQQIATPVHDIVAGLCFAVARNFISSMARGKKLEFPLIFQGGVAVNAGVVRAFREILSAGWADLIIPEYHASMGAIGAIFHTFSSRTQDKAVIKGLEGLDRYLKTGDPAHNMNLVEKLINLKVIPIPLEFLPISGENITKDYRQMYWPNGKSILAAARIIGRDKKLHVVYMSNYCCGPDSFLAHFVHEEMAGKPYLELEIDEHSADAGLITRCEAFLDSMRGSKRINKEQSEVYIPKGFSTLLTKDRVLYFPYMCDAGEAIAAASRNCGIEAHVLPREDEKDLELGRKYITGKECFPMICTTGSFLKKLMEPGTDPKKISFFMPDHNGPCRFGQYNKFQSILFKRLGFDDVRIISPSNDTSYTEISAGQGTKFRYLAWKGIVAVDLLRKLKQERKPYELNPGSTERTYNEALSMIVESIEHRGTKDFKEILKQTAHNIYEIPLINGIRKPLIAVVGEIFMRDNPF
ncbi:MAG: hypothetical protein IH594_03870 [Bacteroidales bacterium]|nr:hypothetical protein [Bacteroidales bacterium]